MAYRKVNDNSLASVADAIRSKGGTSDALVFPDGFVSAISAIQTGGGAIKPYIEETYDSAGNFISANLHGYTNIRDSMFSQSTLTNIILPTELVSIGNMSFSGCGNLTLTSLPAGITSIGNRAFRDCSSLALTSLPERLTSIGSQAFINCSSLALTSLPERLTSIGPLVFSACGNLAITSIPAGITSIGAKAFGHCMGLTELTFLGTPTDIAPDAFEGCENLTTINVPWPSEAVAYEPWGAGNAIINYNYTGG